MLQNPVFDHGGVGSDSSEKGNRHSSEDEQRRVPALRKVVMKVMRMRRLQRFVEPIVRPLIHSLVKGELESVQEKFLNSVQWNSGNKIHPSESRSLRLQFMSKISRTVFTGIPIEGEGTTLKLALVDALTGDIVRSGPEASAKVEIVVLDGNEEGNWTLEEFNNKIVRVGDGKKSMLSGNSYLNLKEGIVAVDIFFRHTNHWMSLCKFRLGARVVDHSNGTNVREAMTESFTVKDRRLMSKKRYPPSLSDEVWRLENIGKNGPFHKRLSSINIRTVEDFLIQFFINSQRLQHILGKNMYAKVWEATVKHAQTCKFESEMYYYPPISQQKNCVVFNVERQVKGLFSECQYVPIAELSETQKADAHKLVVSALEHWEDVVRLDDHTSPMHCSLHSSDALYPSNSATMYNSNGRNFGTFHMIDGYEHSQPSTSSLGTVSPGDSIVNACTLDDYGLHNNGNVDHIYDQASSFPGHATNCLDSDNDLEAFFQDFNEDKCVQFLNLYHELHSENPGVELRANQQCAASDLPVVCAAAIPSGKARRRWKKVCSVLRLFSMKSVVNLKGTHVVKKLRVC